MTRRSIASVVLLAAGILIGTARDRVPPREPIVIGEYEVLAADFHVHSSTWSDGAVTPWGLVLEAERQGLDAIALTGHNQTLDAKWARRFASWRGGPIVLVGEEMPTRHHHVVAIGIERTVDWRLDVRRQIEEIHRQGGVAIAAHPGPGFWPGFAPAADLLDGAEICHPLIYSFAEYEARYARFAATGAMAGIGSSDFHGFARLGMCRTFVFARDRSAPAILDALRARRTVVYARGGVYGDPALVALAQQDGRLSAARPDYAVDAIDRVGQVAGLAGLFGLVLAAIPADALARTRSAKSPARISTDG